MLDNRLDGGRGTRD